MQEMLDCKQPFKKKNNLLKQILQQKTAKNRHHQNFYSIKILSHGYMYKSIQQSIICFVCLS